jgi:hypothetical protein
MVGLTGADQNDASVARAHRTGLMSGEEGTVCPFLVEAERGQHRNGEHDNDR